MLLGPSVTDLSVYDCVPRLRVGVDLWINAEPARSRALIEFGPQVYLSIARTLSANAAVVKHVGSANSSKRERVVPVGVGGGAQQRFGHRGRVRRQSRDARTPFVGGGQQSVMFDDLLHEPEPKRGAGIDVVPAHVVGECSLVAQAAGQRPTGADLRDQSEAAERGQRSPRVHWRRPGRKSGPTPGQLRPRAPLSAATKIVSDPAMSLAIPPNSRRIHLAHIGHSLGRAGVVRRRPASSSSHRLR